MKNSRSVFSEVQKKAGSFPFNIRCLEDEKRSRLGLQEAVQHSLVKPYEVVSVAPSLSLPFFCFVRSPRASSYTAPHTFVAGFHFTIALLPAGPTLITHPPVWYKPALVKTDKELDNDDEFKALLARNLRENKKSKKKKAKAESGDAADGDEA